MSIILCIGARVLLYLDIHRSLYYHTHPAPNRGFHENRIPRTTPSPAHPGPRPLPRRRIRRAPVPRMAARHSGVPGLNSGTGRPGYGSHSPGHLPPSSAPLKRKTASRSRAWRRGRKPRPWVASWSMLSFLNPARCANWAERNARQEAAQRVLASPNAQHGPRGPGRRRRGRPDRAGDPAHPQEILTPSARDAMNGLPGNTPITPEELGGSDLPAWPPSTN